MGLSSAAAHRLSNGMPTTSAMVPELMTAKKALVEKLKAPMTQSDADFIYKTIRQIERLQSINDLTKEEARVLRKNLNGSTTVTPGTSQELRKLLKRHSVGRMPRRRQSKGVGPRMGPGQYRAAVRGNAQGSSSASLGLPRIGSDGPDASRPPSAPETAVQKDEWSAITLFQDEQYLQAENKKQGLYDRRKKMYREQLNEHLALQEQEYKRRELMEAKYAEEQRKQLENWREQELTKARARQVKNAEERVNLDRMLALNQARERMEQERDEAMDATLVAKAVQDLQDETDRLTSKKLAQTEYNRKVKEDNAVQLAIKARRQGEQQELEKKAVREAQQIMDKNENDRNARIQAQADRLTKMMAMGGKAIQTTQGRIDDDNRRIALHAQRKDRELAEAAEAKKKMLAGLRQEMVAGLNMQLESQEASRLKEIQEAKQVAAQYKIEAERYRSEEELLATRKAKKASLYRAALQTQKLEARDVLPIYAILCFPLRASSNRACCFAQVEEFRQKQALAMNGNERGINGDLLKKAGIA